MTPEIVEYMCKGKSTEDISSTYSKTVSNYNVHNIIWHRAITKKTRLDLSYAILNFIQDMERTADLCKSLH